MPGNVVAFMQPGLTNSEIFSELSAERPVFYADGPHAMMLVAGQSFNGNPVAGWVLDPAPAIPGGMGPFTIPGVPAVGLRALMPNELHGYFIATVNVT